MHCECSPDRAGVAQARESSTASRTWAAMVGIGQRMRYRTNPPGGIGFLRAPGARGYSSVVRPCRMANLTSEGRSLRPSFCMSLRRYVSTERGERPSAAALSMLLLPSTTSRSTSRSRAVRCAVATRPCMQPSMSKSVIPAPRKRLPVAVARTALTTSSPADSFEKITARPRA